MYGESGNSIKIPTILQKETSLFSRTGKSSNPSSAVLQRIFRKYISGKLLLPKYTDMWVPQDAIKSYHYAALPSAFV